MLVARLLASDFPSENPRIQNRTILIHKRCVSLRNSLGRKENLTFIAGDFKNFALNKAYRIKKKI